MFRLGFTALSRLSTTTATASVSALSTMQLPASQLALVLRPAVLELAALFSKHQHELRVAGGAVRDLIQGLEPHDLDFATTATPDQMKAMFQQEDVRMINETGEKHGTITARLQDENFECTTLRIDIKTDGRHAEVQFTKDWYLDSNRRDLTINSMFLGLDGTVYDYFDGINHLKERRVEFVGDPDLRIQEDYLRVLRYFRFYGRIAKSPESHSQEVLDAIKRNADGLARISGERIWSELQKIVVGNYGDQLLKSMLKCSLGPHMGLPETFEVSRCEQWWQRWTESGINPRDLQPMTVLAPGFTVIDDAFPFIARIKCSKKERELLLFIIANLSLVQDATGIKECQDLLADLQLVDKLPASEARRRVHELLVFSCRPALQEELTAWELPTFPVTGGHLTTIIKDKRMTKFVLVDLVNLWKKSNFVLTREELLEAVDEEAVKGRIKPKSKKLKV